MIFVRKLLYKKIRISSIRIKIRILKLWTFQVVSTETNRLGLPLTFHTYLFTFTLFSVFFLCIGITIKTTLILGVYD